MRRFATGLLMGLILGAVPPALAARFVGASDYLLGWDVVTTDGDTPCQDPWVWVETHEIECG
jgi:hypothetical protein